MNFSIKQVLLISLRIKMCMIWLIMFLELKQVLIHMRERIEVEMLQNHYYIEFCKQMAFLMAQRFIPLNTMN